MRMLVEIPGRSVILVIIISGPNENSQKTRISVNVLAANSQDGVLVISGPNENSQKAST